jgi:outer membrane protein OmpA-like peptidoglycan-associated protein
MKTKMLLLALLMGTATTIFAQTSTVEERVEYTNDKYKVETNGFWDNWFISLGAGPQVFFGDHDNRAPFGDRISPAVDLAVGKWFTPVVGFRAMYSGLYAKGATKWENTGYSNSYGTGEAIADPAHGLQGQKFYMGNVHVDALFNLNNLFAGYNPKRVWHCSVYAGMGWAWVYDKKSDAGEFAANIGVLNTFRLCDALDLNVDVRGMLAKDGFDDEIGGSQGEGNLSLTVGLTYKFKQRGWNRAKTVYRTDYGPLDELRQQVSKLSDENEQLRKHRCPEPKEVKEFAASNVSVFFNINSSVIASKKDLVNVKEMAEYAKANDKVMVVTGYADSNTGSADYNQKLSEKRAKTVVEQLVKMGVDRNKIEVVAKGGVDTLSPISYNRRVVVTMK